MGGVRNGAAEEDWRWDLNPGMAAMLEENHVAEGAGRQDVAARQSSLLAVWKNAGETLQEGKG